MRELVEANNHTIEVTSFRKRLLAWGQKHFRPFPWRCTADPYRVLIAEVMLHRTQASQVVPVYEQFIARYSDVATLAKAKREELRKSLRPLGLHWRIDLMHEMASDLMVRFHGQVPQEKGELLSLPGVSEYIASAVLCFAWNSPQPLIDTNTVRVTGRLFGLATKDSSRRNRVFRHLIATLVSPKKPKLYNYALLDLAAQLCVKRQPPDCKRCPLQRLCTEGSRSVGIQNRDA